MNIMFGNAICTPASVLMLVLAEDTRLQNVICQQTFRSTSGTEASRQGDAALSPGPSFYKGTDVKMVSSTVVPTRTPSP